MQAQIIFRSGILITNFVASIHSNKQTNKQINTQNNADSAIVAYLAGSESVVQVGLLLLLWQYFNRFALKLLHTRPTPSTAFSFSLSNEKTTQFHFGHQGALKL